LNGAVDVILEVEGVTQTPAQSPDGDTEVRALYKGRTLETEKVLVVVPAAIHSPHPEFIGTATIASEALDAHTSMAMIHTPDGYKAMTYTYLACLTITVDDQFGNTIHPIYEGAAVTEQGDISITKHFLLMERISTRLASGIWSGMKQ
jgi:hypothetical protein